LCIAKTASAIVAEGVTVPAPRGPALIALDGANAWVYFPATRQLARWSAGALTPVVFHPDALHRDGEVLSLRADLTMAVRRGNTTWIVAANGALLDSLPDGAGPVLLIPGAAVYATGDSLMVRRDGGSEVRFPASGILSLSMLGDGLVEARAGSVLYALVTDSGSERLLQLPQAGGGSRR
jgi:hypothetical protein